MSSIIDGLLWHSSERGLAEYHGGLIQSTDLPLFRVALLWGRERQSIESGGLHIRPHRESANLISAHYVRLRYCELLIRDHFASWLWGQ